MPGGGFTSVGGLTSFSSTLGASTDGALDAGAAPTGATLTIPFVTRPANSGTLTVAGPPATNAPDYVGSWFPSLAHRRLKLVKTDGTVAYRTVTSCSAGSGTQDLALNASLAGAL